jgi:hypothetical protein
MQQYCVIEAWQRLDIQYTKIWKEMEYKRPNEKD